MLELTVVILKDTWIKLPQHRLHVPKVTVSDILTTAGWTRSSAGSIIGRLQMIYLYNFKVHIYTYTPSSNTLSYVQPCHNVEVIILQWSEGSGVKLEFHYWQGKHDNPANFLQVRLFVPRDTFCTKIYLCWKEICRVSYSPLYCIHIHVVCLFVYLFICLFIYADMNMYAIERVLATIANSTYISIYRLIDMFEPVVPLLVL